MFCPHHKEQKLDKSIIHNVEVDYCPVCLGLWFEENELREAKDEEDKDLKWLDIDLWKNKEKFKVSCGVCLCPVCRMPLYQVYYGDSGVIVDVCNLCHGTWLDRAEFKKITDWLKKKVNQEILHNYTKNLLKEGADIFIGPEDFKEEVMDFLVIIKLLIYKFASQHPFLFKIIAQMPK